MWGFRVLLPSLFLLTGTSRSTEILGGGDGVLTAITFFVLLSPFLLIYQKFSLLNPSPTSSVVNVSFFVGYFSFLHLQRSLLYPRVFNTLSPCERRRHSSQVYNK